MLRTNNWKPSRGWKVPFSAKNPRFLQRISPILVWDLWLQFGWDFGLGRLCYHRGNMPVFVMVAAPNESGQQPPFHNRRIHYHFILGLCIIWRLITFRPRAEPNCFFTKTNRKRYFDVIKSLFVVFTVFWIKFGLEIEKQFGWRRLAPALWLTAIYSLADRSHSIYRHFWWPP